MGQLKYLKNKIFLKKYGGRVDMADNNDNNGINNIILNIENLNVILGNEKIVEDLSFKVKKKNF